MLVDFEDGRPVAVRGDESNPVYQGYFCVKGQQLLEAWRHPARLLHSQKRVADGGYRPIASARACDEIADRLGEIRERRGPRSIALYSGTLSTANPASRTVATAWRKALGSPMAFISNTIDQPGLALASLAERPRAAADPPGYPMRPISRRMMTAYSSSARDLSALRAKWPYDRPSCTPANSRVSG